MLLDELMGYAIILPHDLLVVTAKLETNFLRPIRSNIRYIARAQVTDQSNRTFRVHGKITNVVGDLCYAEAKGEFIALDTSTGKRVLGSSAENPVLEHMLSRTKSIPV